MIDTFNINEKDHFVMLCSENREAQATQLAADIAGKLSTAIEVRGRASIAFSGGSTPTLMFSALAKAPVDWSKVSVTLVDERCVGIDHERSNAKLLCEHLLDKLVQKPTFYPLYLPDETIDTRCERLAAFPLPFDIVHLGMGEDAHTASFFPDAPNIADMLDTNGMGRIATTRSENSQEQRITWTLSTLLSSTQIVVQLHGEGKLVVMESILKKLESEVVEPRVRYELPMLALLEQTQLVSPQGVPVTIYYAGN